MQGLRWVSLPPDERNEFLGDGGIGVLSFGTDTDDPPRSIPISYGYADETEQFYFRLSFPPETSKADVIENPVSFVVFGNEDGQWKSVVATGRLQELSSLPSESAAVQRMWAVSIPTVEIFDQPREDISFHDFRLETESITGRQEST
ncbi:pyridoxamine 5'-phosphate oxidase family protein [Natrarchaeobaculum sulfurireducens]|nr:pyridoxamine 5'-phosphate oxidase family protein [Natrarchaeobaculum sulfurireducens]AXR77398.1 Nitroimidazol reductase NimA [Natrarchaeobaculum sulfurireducens]